MQQAVLPAAALRALRPAVLRSLGLAARWFRDTMTDAATRRLFYAYDPTTKAHSRQRSPIRDLGTAANLALLQNQLPAGEVSADRHMFDEVIANTVSEYLSYLLHEHRPVSEVATAAGYHGGGAASTTPLRPPPAAGYAFLGSHHLHEPSSIAHSAMLILALCNWEAAEQRIPQLLLAAGSGDGGGSGSHHTSQHRVVEQLADGILSQQRQTDGTYAVYFPYFDRHHQRHHEDVGWELYAGEEYGTEVVAKQSLVVIMAVYWMATATVCSSVRVHAVLTVCATCDGPS